jgi:hypothetical protein
MSCHRFVELCAAPSCDDVHVWGTDCLLRLCCAVRGRPARAWLENVACLDHLCADVRVGSSQLAEMAAFPPVSLQPPIIIRTLAMAQ